MYRIGQFSRFTKVTIKALRFYESEGLLEPDWIDPINGYRYYSTGQLALTHKIVALRQCGFPISEIHQILAGNNVGALLSDRKRELEKQVRETSTQLASITHYLDNLGREEYMSYEVVIKELPRVLVYGTRMIVESYDSYFTEIPRIGAEMTAANPELRCAEDPFYCFIIYHDGEYREHDMDMEFCEAVTSRGNGKETDTIKFKLIDRVPQAACVMHKGPYSTLSFAYKAVYEWIEANGFVPAENPRESFIDGIWNKDSSEDWLTEIQVPLAEKDPGSK
ncbi:MAG TPA: MerR family transcriptional regulator [Rectinemataceae bacterium]|nr:MerR family transcriptional regulator [Rectinemataceae bacterium]